MFVRLTFCKFDPAQIKDARKIYNDEIVPAVRKQKGNLRIYMLEPTQKSEDFISVSEWKTMADAETYHNSGLYEKLVGKLKAYFTKDPVLKTYNVEEVKVPVDHL
jgi:quinol monooxygenase YgiN